MCDVNKLVEVLREECFDKDDFSKQIHDVFLQTHNFPDADAVGSALGLQEILKHFGINSKICYQGELGRYSTRRMADVMEIEMYSVSEIASELDGEDVVICVDSQKGNANIDDIIGRELAVVDHHPIFVDGDYEYEHIEIVGACSSLVTKYFIDLGLVPTEKTATALLYGLKMDTLKFTRGVTAFDIEMFAFLHPLANQAQLVALDTNNMYLDDLLAYSEAIKNIRIENRIGFTFVDFNCPDALIAILSDFILSIEEVEISVVYCMRENGYKFSVRSETSAINVGHLINKVMMDIGSGGGHASMAGGFLPKDSVVMLFTEDEINRLKESEDIEEVENLLFDKIITRFIENL